jgi:hypothetical protein
MIMTATIVIDCGSASGGLAPPDHEVFSQVGQMNAQPVKN